MYPDVQDVTVVQYESVRPPGLVQAVMFTGMILHAGQRRRLVIALVPLKCSDRNLHFIGYLLPRRKYFGALALSKTKQTGLGLVCQ